MKIKSYITANRHQFTFMLMIFAFLILLVWLYGFRYQSRIGPEQPIPFSHLIHANNKEISCVFCHDGTLKTGPAGIPPLERCMLCHSRVIIHHPEIEKLHAYYNSGTPVEWIRVEEIPDFVYFNHSLHVFRQIDCSECHGDIRKMDRVEVVNQFKMGFCINCHEEKGASTDCFTCHR